jgi:hypothetical protein
LSTKSSQQPDAVKELHPGTPMRKCETVITLSAYGSQQPFGGSEIQTSMNGTFSSGGGPSDKAKVTKNKILSTSSSTLNCLLHSTSRNKLFSSWKLSSGESNSSRSDYPDQFVASINPNSSGKVRSSGASANDSADMQQIFKSQLSISESGGGVPITPMNRLRRNVSINNNFYTGGTNSAYSRSSSVASFGWRDAEDFEILCRLCLCNVKNEETVEISACSCRYCTDVS